MPVISIHEDFSCLWGPMNLALGFHTRCQALKHQPCFEQGSAFGTKDPLLFQFHYRNSYQKVVCRVTISHSTCSTKCTETCRTLLYCHLLQLQHSKRSMTYWLINSLFCQKTCCSVLSGKYHTACASIWIWPSNN